jgi:hypothetical protein
MAGRGPVAAVTGGDLQGLLDVLAPDVVLVADGGGVVQAVVNPVVGASTRSRTCGGPSANSHQAPSCCRCCSTALSGSESSARSTEPTRRSASSSRTDGSTGSTRSATPPSSVGSTPRRRSGGSRLRRSRTTHFAYCVRGGMQREGASAFRWAGFLAVRGWRPIRMRSALRLRQPRTRSTLRCQRDQISSTRSAKRF